MNEQRREGKKNNRTLEQTENLEEKKKGLVFMFSEITRKLVIMWNDPIQGEPPPSPPLPSNASLERMIDVLTLHYFPFPNETLTYCSTDSATRQIKKSNVDKKKKKKKV